MDVLTLRKQIRRSAIATRFINPGVSLIHHAANPTPPVILGHFAVNLLHAHPGVSQPPVDFGLLPHSRQLRRAHRAYRPLCIRFHCLSRCLSRLLNAFPNLLTAFCNGFVGQLSRLGHNPSQNMLALELRRYGHSRTDVRLVSRPPWTRRFRPSRLLRVLPHPRRSCDLLLIRLLSRRRISQCRLRRVQPPRFILCFSSLARLPPASRPLLRQTMRVRPVVSHRRSLAGRHWRPQLHLSIRLLRLIF
jgi:hypothetical protein